MGLKSRRKGGVGEREACEVLRPLWPDVQRTAMQSRGGGEQADLANTPGFWVEVGRGKSVSPTAKWEQAKEDVGLGYYAGCAADPPSNTVPIALTRRDRGEWLVTMHVDDFIRLVRQGTETIGGEVKAAEVRWANPCAVTGCVAPAIDSGFCAAHKLAAYLDRHPPTTRETWAFACVAPGCSTPTAGAKFCPQHSPNLPEGT